MRALIPVWRGALRLGLSLPQTPDPNYRSLETLLHHAFRAARGYMTWLCEKLQLPDPGMDPAPEPEAVERRADEYLEHLLSRWRTPLAEAEEERFNASHKTRWGELMSCLSMLEHAVLHPMRHRVQLEELMEGQT